MVDYLLGSDPELMLRDAATKALKSAIPVIQEGKGMGRPLDEEGNSVLHDNVLVEFNTKPATSERDFVKTIGGTLRKIHELLKPEGLELVVQASADFPRQELDNIEAVTFGCEPDFDAYRMVANEVPPEAPFMPFRSAGGHLHIGKGRNRQVAGMLESIEGKIAVVKALDVFCTVPSTFLDKDKSAAARRKLYGRAGCHRPKNYGVEYRALSNWWLLSPIHTTLVYRLAKHAVSVAATGKIDKLIEKLGGPEKVQKVINDFNQKACRTLYNKHISPLLDERTRQLVTRVLITPPGQDFYQAWRISK